MVIMETGNRVSEETLPEELAGEEGGQMRALDVIAHLYLAFPLHCEG